MRDSPLQFVTLKLRMETDAKVERDANDRACLFSSYPGGIERTEEQQSLSFSFNNIRFHQKHKPLIRLDSGRGGTLFAGDTLARGFRLRSRLYCKHS